MIMSLENMILIGLEALITILIGLYFYQRGYKDGLEETNRKLDKIIKSVRK
jgi:uncharacterized protein (DUF2164 family)